MSNLYLSLWKWASRSDENFTTDALAHLLMEMRDRQPNAFRDFLRWFTEKAVDIQPEEASGVSVETQRSTKYGRPDIWIQTTRHVVLVEVKCDAVLHPGQIASTA